MKLGCVVLAICAGCAFGFDPYYKKVVCFENGVHLLAPKTCEDCLEPDTPVPRYSCHTKKGSDCNYLANYGCKCACEKGMNSSAYQSASPSQELGPGPSSSEQPENTLVPIVASLLGCAAVVGIGKHSLSCATNCLDADAHHLLIGQAWWSTGRSRNPATKTSSMNCACGLPRTKAACEGGPLARRL